MLNRHSLRFFLLLVFILGGSTLSNGKAFAESIESDFQTRSRAHYAIECSIDDNGQLLEGTGVISFKNTTSDPIGQIAIKWLRQGGETLEVTSNGKGVSFLTDVNSSRVVFKLPEAIKPGDDGSVEIKFSGVKPTQSLNNKIGFASWHPQLDWGFQTHADFDVKINAPSEYTVLTSGVFDDSVGRYQAEGVRSFIVILCKEHKVMEANAKDVLVRCIYTPKSKECARLVVDTAVDAINFYRGHFGFYPYRILTIVPGMDNPAGGYPVAPCVVAIHGMEKFNSRPKYHWQWITAHEIGHQYCGEHILSNDPADPFNWLMIGLGIYADREYSQARNLSSEKHQGLMDRYIGGVRDGLDTTINITPEQRSKIQFDFNNVVKHGKSYSIISALDCVLGKETFSRIYRRCLKEFGGRRLGVLEFQAVCEEEADQDLGWFFEQWVNSNKHLSYEISSQKYEKRNNQYVSKVEVKCTGDLKMPIPVAVYFEDGTSQTKFTDRLKDINILEFISKSPLKKARLDPKKALAFASVIAPAPIRPADFEIVEIDFEPIRKGKNVVWMKVKNTSSKAQIIDINVFSRSDSIGWGRNFHDSIKGGETKRMRFAFKIFGPITDSTFINLKFYNPDPAADFDEKKWKQQNKNAKSFKKIKYDSKNLEKLDVDTKLFTSVSKSQKTDIVRAFEQFQAYIRDENYKNAWRLFTKDYQNIEFRNEFDRFRKIMDSETMASIFVWKRKEFLALKPGYVKKKDDTITLTASNESESWTIDYVSVNGKWIIDWIGGYTPAFLRKN